jgi:ABC-type sulfate transport system substrate-binding protein
MFNSYISSLIKIGISKEKIMQSYDVSEELYEEINRSIDTNSLPTECQRKLMNGEIKLADEFDLLEDKTKITHWSW